MTRMIITVTVTVTSTGAQVCNYYPTPSLTAMIILRIDWITAEVTASCAYSINYVAKC